MHFWFDNEDSEDENGDDNNFKCTIADGETADFDLSSLSSKKKI